MTLDGHLDPSPPPLQVMVTIEHRWLTYYEHVVQYSLNICYFGVYTSRKSFVM